MTKVRVSELLPGDLVTLPEADASATFIQQVQHPLWPHLRLVIWKLDDGTWSLDALDARQDVGLRADLSHADRKQALQRALLGA
jgi:hypothetical protein